MKHFKHWLWFCTFCATADNAAAENWPAWRGPAGNGIAAEKGLPVTWTEKETLWKLPLPGMGGATPAVWGDNIFLTSEDGDAISFICIDTDGKEKWKRKLGKAGSRARTDEGSSASPSPITDGKTIWAVTGEGDMAAFDFAGKELWRIDLQKVFGKFQYQFGMHMTPVLDDGTLYIMLIHKKPGIVAALDAKTGSTKWEIERPSDGYAECYHSYASPMMWKKGDKKLLIVHGNDYCTAHDTSNGREVWRVGNLNGNPNEKGSLPGGGKKAGGGGYNPTLRFVASPGISENLIVVPSAKGGPVVGIDPAIAKGLVLKGQPGEVWRRAKDTPDVPTPLIHDGVVYLYRETGSLVALDAKTGEEIYNERTTGGRHRASPVYADGNLFLASRDGVVSVVKAGRKFELLASNNLKEVITATPVLANGRIYIRTYNSLVAVGTK